MTEEQRDFPAAAFSWLITHREDEGEGRKTKISHTSVFHSKASLSSCVFTPLPEEIKVNMLAYLLLPPKQDRLLLRFIKRAPPPQPPFLPPSLSSSSLFTVIPLHGQCNLVFACLAGEHDSTNLQSLLHIFYLLCLTRADKPVFITPPDPQPRTASCTTVFLNLVLFFLDCRKGLVALVLRD